ncbi:MAG TPA: hypothetical protein P5252_08045 [Candidatus Cloacimonas sp.]|nr:hypothetical protein [Candidatus Cloacimonas sp.]
MSTRRNSVISLLMFLIVFIMACEAKNSYIANITDLNGTWVNVKAYQSSPKIRNWQYSWGTGKRIVETTLEVDLEKKEVLLPGTGAFLIQSVSKDSPSVVSIDIKGPGVEGGLQTKVVFHFLDKDTYWIECSDLEGMFSVGKAKPWYRLSGPSK